MDAPSVNLVVNYDLPNVTENFQHRTGRCARFHREGSAFSLVEGPGDQEIIDRLIAHFKIDINEVDGELEALGDIL